MYIEFVRIFDPQVLLQQNLAACQNQIPPFLHFILYLQNIFYFSTNCINKMTIIDVLLIVYIETEPDNNETYSVYCIRH